MVDASCEIFECVAGHVYRLLHHKTCCLGAVNLLPARMKLRIFADMPWSVRIRAGVAPLKRQHPKELIEPRVGDDDILPFDMLYRQMLDLVRCRSFCPSFCGISGSSAQQFATQPDCTRFQRLFKLATCAA